MKKILFLAPSLALGGAERVLVNLLKKMDFNKYDVTLCLFSNHGIYFSELPSKVKVISVFHNKQLARIVSYIQRKWKLTRILRLIVRLAVRERYDVGICFSDGLLTDVLLMVSDRFKKTLTWVHSCYQSQSSLNRIYTPEKIKELKKNRYSRLTGIVFVSQNSQREFENIFGTYDKEFCVYNLFDFTGIDSKVNEYPIELDNNKVNFIALGRLVAVKEFSKLIKAAKVLKEKKLDFNINIIGDGPLRMNLKKLIERYDLPAEVHLLGFKQNPYPYLKKSDVLVLTSSSEALPTVLVEAMYLDKPVIATSCPGCIEITDSGKYGILTEHSVDDIAQKMEMIIVNPDMRKEYADLSKKRAEYFNEYESLNRIDKIIGNL